MMKIKQWLPHLTLTMGIVMSVLIYLDDRNPMMGFLQSDIGRIYSGIFCILAIVSSVVFIFDLRKKKI